jgi:hypothetical protein
MGTPQKYNFTFINFLNFPPFFLLLILPSWTCYDGLRPDDAQEALFLLRQHLGPQARAGFL